MSHRPNKHLNDERGAVSIELQLQLLRADSAAMSLLFNPKSLTVSASVTVGESRGASTKQACASYRGSDWRIYHLRLHCTSRYPHSFRKEGQSRTRASKNVKRTASPHHLQCVYLPSCPHLFPPSLVFPLVLLLSHPSKPPQPCQAVAASPCRALAGKAQAAHPSPRFPSQPLTYRQRLQPSTTTAITPYLSKVTSCAMLMVDTAVRLLKITWKSQRVSRRLFIHAQVRSSVFFLCVLSLVCSGDLMRIS
jgi:hypothetical protein